MNLTPDMDHNCPGKGCRRDDCENNAIPRCSTQMCYFHLKGGPTKEQCMTLAYMYNKPSTVNKFRKVNKMSVAEDEAKRGVFFGSDLRALGVNSDYFTVIVPYVESPFRTEWHPTDASFAPLTRGCFATMQEAIVWALDKLGPLEIANHWYVKEITHCKRCGEYKEPHNEYCSGSCMVLAKEGK